MSPLYVKWKNKPVFHPLIRLESTGYCRAGQWMGQMFEPGCFVGLSTIRETPNVREAVAHYLSELKRCRHQSATETQE